MLSLSCRLSFVTPQACLQPDLVTLELVTLELSGAVTIMCHKDGDVVVYSAATRGDRV